MRNAESRQNIMQRLSLMREIGSLLFTDGFDIINIPSFCSDFLSQKDSL